MSNTRPVIIIYSDGIIELQSSISVSDMLVVADTLRKMALSSVMVPAPKNQKDG